MKTVIEMAREAGFKEHNGMIYVTTINDDCAKELKAFAELVRADERRAMMQLFTDPENQPTQHGTVTLEHMQREIADEREACAKVCEELHPGLSSKRVAEIIRERRNQMICDECETVAHCMKNGCVPKTTKKDEALKLALEALEGIHPGNMTPMAEEYWNKAITALREALAESALERMAENARELGLDYEQPAQRTWVHATAWRGLTDEEIQTIWRSSEHMNNVEVCRAIEAKLRSKNT